MSKIQQKDVEGMADLIEERLSDMLDDRAAFNKNGALVMMALALVASRLVVRRARLGKGFGSNLKLGADLLGSWFQASVMHEAAKMGEKE